MNAELKRLEEEKMTILRSVLDDGYDPKLVMVNESGDRETIKLSDFVKKRELLEQSSSLDRSVPETKKRLTLVHNSEKE
jgi:hypothetical protein